MTAISPVHGIAKTMDRNLQREGSSCANGCTLSEEEVRRTIEELVRYILSLFLSVAVNTVFTACWRANGGGLDETDGASGILPVKPVKSSLSAIFSDCGNHIASDYYSQNTKKLFFHLLPDLQLPEPIPEVDLDQIIESCIADWFTTDFQSAIQDMLSSARVRPNCCATEEIPSQRTYPPNLLHQISALSVESVMVGAKAVQG